MDDALTALRDAREHLEAAHTRSEKIKRKPSKDVQNKIALNDRDWLEILKAEYTDSE